MFDQWPSGVGEIPARPEEPPSFDPRLQAATEQPHFPYQPQSGVEIHTAHIAMPPQNGFVRKSRAEVREMRRRERDEGVKFHLNNSDMDVRVRDLPFTDRVMLRGIPTDMRVTIEQAIDLTSSAGNALGITAALKLVDAEADLSDAVCIAGFIWPRLARTESERVQLMHSLGLTEDDVYLTEDLHPDEKAAYRDFVFRERNGEKEDTARLASFPGAGMAEAPDREAWSREGSSAVASAADGGGGLRPGDAVSA